MKFKKVRKYLAVAASLLLAAAVFATITPITPITPLGPYNQGNPVTAGSLNVTWTAADTTNGNSVKLTGHEVLEFCNFDSAAHTVTITSVADFYGRTADITTYSLAAESSGVPTCGVFSFLTGIQGWQQPSDQSVHLSATNALVEYAAFIVTR